MRNVVILRYSEGSLPSHDKDEEILRSTSEGVKEHGRVR
jgi:hypothetical protein